MGGTSTPTFQFHAARHVDGGNDEIVSALDLNAIPTIPASKAPELVQLIRQIHPTLQVLGTMDEATYSNIVKSGNNYILDNLTLSDDYSLAEVSKLYDPTCTICKTITATAIRTGIQLQMKSTMGTVGWGYSINSETVNCATGGSTESATYVTQNIYAAIANADIIRIGYYTYNHTSSSAYLRNAYLYGTGEPLSGNVLSAAISTDAAVLSFYKQLKILVANGTSTHATPVQAEIYGSADSYAAALNTTKFTIDPTDPRIILKRDALDTITASSNTQTVWNMTVAGGMAALPNHGTILATQIGVAAVLVVEKSILGDFSDTVVLTENTDYVVDYSTRTATKITLSSGTGIVSTQSKLRFSWIADVMKIDGATNNTALKVKLYLNRTSTSETSPTIEPIAIGSGKYCELLYGT